MSENLEKWSNPKIILTSLGVIGKKACQLVTMTDAHIDLPELEALGVCIGLKKVVVDDYLVIVQIYFLEDDVVQLFKVARTITTGEMIEKADAIVSKLAEEAVETNRMIRQEPPQAENHD